MYKFCIKALRLCDCYMQIHMIHGVPNRWIATLCCYQIQIKFTGVIERLYNWRVFPVSSKWQIKKKHLLAFFVKESFNSSDASIFHLIISSNKYIYLCNYHHFITYFSLPKCLNWIENFIYFTAFETIFCCEPYLNWNYHNL